MESLTTLFEQYGSQIPVAFWMNIKLTVLAAIGSFVLGVVLALFRISPVASLRAVVSRVRLSGRAVM